MLEAVFEYITPATLVQSVSQSVIKMFDPHLVTK